MDLQAIGELLLAARKAKKLSRDDVNGITGIATSTLQDIEAGTGNPAIKTLLRLCHAVGVDFDELAAVGLHKKTTAVTSPDTTVGDTLPTPLPSSEGSPDAAALTLKGLGFSGQTTDPAVLEGIGFAFLRASQVERADRALRSADARKTGGRDDRPRLVGKNPPDVQRLKKRKRS